MLVLLCTGTCRCLLGAARLDLAWHDTIVCCEHCDVDVDVDVRVLCILLCYCYCYCFITPLWWLTPIL